GNVWEWVQDGWHGNYQGAPTDGGEWTAGADASKRVARGGSWYLNATYARAANRDSDSPDLRSYIVGFRLARTVP
ncbi:MAG: SUMF1/EgtB/PvdO family nonheme iron enzyme, partial [Hylemonella sp.]|nr:SUMF1/EgtB/PvdO family nonheme iron enzyme [Hylemonella sp.]